MSQLPWLEAGDPFPAIETALDDPNGLLAAGGALDVPTLLAAYRQGIFPWYSDGQPILWWSPSPRCIIKSEWLHLSRSLRKHQRKYRWQLSFDRCFEEVIAACALRSEEAGTWITEEMQEAYIALHHAGHAHSVEVWDNDTLIGGLYGIAIGGCFFGESMFSRRSNASKIAFWGLCWQLERWQYSLIDCQLENPHLLSLGARCIPREDFSHILKQGLQTPVEHSQWKFDEDLFSNV